MSSTLSRPTASTSQLDTAPTIAEAAIDSAPHASPAASSSETEEKEFAGFAKAIGLGAAIGTPAIVLLVIVMMRIAAPSVSLAAAIPVILWTAIWIGVFIGGTVTVGMWSQRNMH